ncbi:putative Bracovirus protein MdBV-1-22 [Microplitis demolitor]
MQAVIDFCGYKIPDDKFGVKEFSIYYITKDNKIIRKIFNVVKPPSEWHNLQQVTKNEYKKFYETYGINFKAGFYKYNLSIYALNKYLRTMKCIYVSDLGKKDILLKYILYRRKKNIICMNDLGYVINQEMKTKCSNHENPYKNNCVNDNALAMTDWLLKSKLNNCTNVNSDNDSNDQNEEP